MEVTVGDGSQQDVHHFELSLHHQARVGQYRRGGMPLFEHGIWILGDMHGREERVVLSVGIMQGSGQVV
jgi:hypothetical protein